MRDVTTAVSHMERCEDQVRSNKKSRTHRPAILRFDAADLPLEHDDPAVPFPDISETVSPAKNRQWSTNFLSSVSLAKEQSTNTPVKQIRWQYFQQLLFVALP